MSSSRGLITYIDPKQNVVIYENLPVKGLCGLFYQSL
jgi:hypothetical protein